MATVDTHRFIAVGWRRMRAANHPRAASATNASAAMTAMRTVSDSQLTHSEGRFLFTAQRPAKDVHDVGGTPVQVACLLLHRCKAILNSSKLAACPGYSNSLPSSSIRVNAKLPSCFGIEPERPRFERSSVVPEYVPSQIAGALPQKSLVGGGESGGDGDGEGREGGESGGEGWMHTKAR